MSKVESNIILISILQLEENAQIPNNNSVNLFVFSYYISKKLVFTLANPSHKPKD